MACRVNCESYHHKFNMTTIAFNLIKTKVIFSIHIQPHIYWSAFNEFKYAKQNESSFRSTVIKQSLLVIVQHAYITRRLRFAVFSPSAYLRIGCISFNISHRIVCRYSYKRAHTQTCTVVTNTRTVAEQQHSRHADYYNTIAIRNVNVDIHSHNIDRILFVGQTSTITSLL